MVTNEDEMKTFTTSKSSATDPKQSNTSPLFNEIHSISNHGAGASFIDVRHEQRVIIAERSLSDMTAHNTHTHTQISPESHVRHVNTRLRRRREARSHRSQMRDHARA